MTSRAKRDSQASPVYFIWTLLARSVWKNCQNNPHRFPAYVHQALDPVSRWSVVISNKPEKHLARLTGVRYREGVRDSRVVNKSPNLVQAGDTAASGTPADVSLWSSHIRPSFWSITCRGAQITSRGRGGGAGSSPRARESRRGRNSSYCLVVRETANGLMTVGVISSFAVASVAVKCSY